MKHLFLSLWPAFALLVSCGNPETPQSEEAYLEKGGEITAATFTSLSGALQAQLQEGGVPAAISYCNLAAMPLVDSLSKVHQATIRRTSLKFRNPDNAPTAAERKVLEAYAAQEQAGTPLQPQLVAVDKAHIAYYAPIRVAGLCLQCHGEVGTTLATADHAYIRQFYPEDQAIGYREGELRGMWSITFQR